MFTIGLRGLMTAACAAALSLLVLMPGQLQAQLIDPNNNCVYRPESTNKPVGERQSGRRRL
jgi:hypothetical protein